MNTIYILSLHFTLLSFLQKESCYCLSRKTPNAITDVRYSRFGLDLYQDGAFTFKLYHTYSKREMNKGHYAIKNEEHGIYTISNDTLRLYSKGNILWGAYLRSGQKVIRIVLDDEKKISNYLDRNMTLSKVDCEYNSSRLP